MNASAAWPENVEVGGSLIGEFGATTGDLYSDSSDLSVYEFYLLMNVELHERVDATVSFLYEEAGTPFGIDEAFMTLEGNEMWMFNLGKMYLPFGRFNSNMANDPFALTLAEINETALMATAQMEQMAVSVYGFNGSVRKNTNDTLDSYGVSFLIGHENMNLKLDYISNLGDADGYTDEDDVQVADLAGAFGISAHAAMDAITVDLEYLTAMDPIGSVNTSNGVNTYGEVESMALEIGMSMEEACNCTLSAALQSSDGAAGLLPETRFSIGYMRPIFEILTLNTELYFDSDYSVADGGSDESGTGLLVDIAAVF